MSETCPSCGADADGRFCNGCGAALSAACRECGNPLPRGARFCNECGAPAAAQPGAAAPSRGHLLPWAVAMAATAALVVSLFWPNRTARQAEVSPPAGSTEAPATFNGPTATGTPPDISRMSPREQAERLFNRVMQANSTGDTAGAKTFVPMAIGAYGNLPERSDDDHYHIAALQLVAGNPAAARAEADTILAKHPDHLLALFTAAEAEQLRDNAAEAKALLTRFLAAYPRESVRRDVPEYGEHQQALPIMEQAARRIVGG
jgi:hypothetical protein